MRKTLALLALSATLSGCVEPATNSQLAIKTPLCDINLDSGESYLGEDQLVNVHTPAELEALLISCSDRYPDYTLEFTLDSEGDMRSVQIAIQNGKIVWAVQTMDPFARMQEIPGDDPKTSNAYEAMSRLLETASLRLITVRVAKLAES
jgi:hypothetical protein